MREEVVLSECERGREKWERHRQGQTEIERDGAFLILHQIIC